MSIFVVRLEHPDGDGWGEHVVPHVLYLKKLIEDGKLLASGPLKGTALRTGFLIMVGDRREDVEAMIDADPFAIEGLICGLTIEEWDPLFGMLADKSTGTAPPGLESLLRSSARFGRFHSNKPTASISVYMGGE